MNTLPFANELNFWRTSKSSPDAWIEKARRQIEALGGVVVEEAFRRINGRSAYLLSFEIDGNNFSVVWPVLPVKKAGEERDARVQAATMLYHDVKSRCLSSLVLGSRTAFFAYMVLPDGRRVASISGNELTEIFPPALPAPKD